jgi:predicted aconitase with swiveling domain
MTVSFKGRAVLPGTVEGKVLVTKRGFNTYASFFTSIHAPTGNAVCADSNNPELYGKNLADSIICLPKTTGSTSSGAVWQQLVRFGVVPKAMLFSQQIDPLAAGGLIVADIWTDKRVITVDQLGDSFLETINSGDVVKIYKTGVVEIHSRSDQKRNE